MALSKLSGDEQRNVFSQLCNVLDPGIAVAFGSISNELRAATKVPRQQLKIEHEAAAALSHNLGMWSCKELLEAREIAMTTRGPTAADLAHLGSLVLPALESLVLIDHSGGAASPDGVQRLSEELSAGALPTLTKLCLTNFLDCLRDSCRGRWLITEAKGTVDSSRSTSSTTRASMVQVLQPSRVDYDSVLVRETGKVLAF